MRLRVLSFNVWARPPPVGKDVAERLARILDDLPSHGCDLALFQEVWTEEARAQLIAGGRSQGFAHSWMHGEARGGSGLLALSRLPIRGSHFRAFTLCGLPQRITQMDYYSGKGVARLDVETLAGSVAVFNTHLHARYAPAEVRDDYVGHRAAEVVEFAAELRNVSDPVIAVGDFNMRDVSPEYRLLTELTRLTDVAATLGAREPTSTLSNPYRSARGAVNESRIDYVFCRSGSERGANVAAIRRVFDTPLSSTQRTAGPAGYSDHAGLLADIEIGGPQQPLAAIPAATFDRARELLRAGRVDTLTRRRGERITAGGGIVMAALAAAAARRPALSRRRFLRASAWGLAGLSATSAAGLFTLAERFVPEELAGYDAIDALLERMAQAEAEGRQ
jgi:endonuclease/exonuclease/phosphatase family metal-dependent hydrolase